MVQYDCVGTQDRLTGGWKSSQETQRNKSRALRVTSEKTLEYDQPSRKTKLTDWVGKRHFDTYLRSFGDDGRRMLKVIGVFKLIFQVKFHYTWADDLIFIDAMLFLSSCGLHIGH